MSEKRIFEGKTTNEAIEKGLKELKLSKNDVDIKVLENEDKRSFFDILTPRVVRVEMTIKEKREEVKKIAEKVSGEIKIDIKVLENAKIRVQEFLDKLLLQTVGEKVEYTCDISQNVIKIDIEDKKADFLIGYRGENLNSMQTILSAIAVKDCQDKIRVELDVLGYREKRKKALEELAEKIAKSVVKTRKAITLEPMTPYERKIIHTKLQDNTRVKTVSIGEGTHRKVVISLK